MEVNQIIFFNLAIYLNILLSFFILFFALAITFIFIKDNFVRSVLSFGYICYLLPIFIIKDWQIDYYDHFFYLKIVSIFFIFVIIFYLILNSLFIKKNISNNYLKNIFIKENKNLLNLKKYIFFFFYLFTIFLLFYFFILKNSFFFAKYQPYIFFIFLCVFQNPAWMIWSFWQPLHQRMGMRKTLSSSLKNSRL